MATPNYLWWRRPMPALPRERPLPPSRRPSSAHPRPPRPSPSNRPSATEVAAADAGDGTSARRPSEAVEHRPCPPCPHPCQSRLRSSWRWYSSHALLRHRGRRPHPCPHPHPYPHPHPHPHPQPSAPCQRRSPHGAGPRCGYETRTAAPSRPCCSHGTAMLRPGRTVGPPAVGGASTRPRTPRAAPHSRRRPSRSLQPPNGSRGSGGGGGSGGDGGGGGGGGDMQSGAKTNG